VTRDASVKPFSPRSTLHAPRSTLHALATRHASRYTLAVTTSSVVAINRPRWRLIALACLVPATLSALDAYFQSRLAGARRVPWPNVIFSSGEWLFVAALTPIIITLARHVPLRRDRLGRVIAIHTLGALLLCVGWATLGITAGWLLDTYPWQGHFPRDYLSWVMTSVPWSVVLYFALLGCVYAFTYFAEAREREAQQARLAAQLAEARLGALRMQLNPHFLFNSLNALAVLVRDQKTRDASRMLELLGGVLRQVLQGEKRQEVPLTDELHFLEQYLAIEQVRFSDRMQVRWSIDASVRDALVPEFILQPLVENAIRHGIARRAEAGIIEISAAADGADLALTVRDDGPGYGASVPTGGVGLTNTRARLETLFGAAGRLELRRAENGGTIASVRFPLRRGAND
jgi:two-component system LytT family sensor kinase